MKRKLDRKQLSLFRQLLLKRREQIAGTFEHFKTDALNGITRRDGDLSSIPSECAELGTQMFEQSLAIDVLQNTSDTIGQIDGALARIDAGTFGLCEACRCVIPHARLRAIPFATLCVKCREAEERFGPRMDLDPTE
jgi:DnaK suppressor protein